MLELRSIDRQDVTSSQRNADEGIISRGIGLNRSIKRRAGVSQGDRSACDRLTLLILDVALYGPQIGLCCKIDGTRKCCEQRKGEEMSNPESNGHKALSIFVPRQYYHR